MLLAAQVLETIRKRALVRPGGRVAVALSGGPDSVALVHLLREPLLAGEVRLVGVAHFNHQIRGAEADEDEAFCCRLAEACALPILVGRADVRETARQEGRSLEDVARRLRYAFLDEATTALGADVMAVAHSLDDQAETFLLRLARGAGPRGLAGIYPRAGRVVRPLIDIDRVALRAYLEERAVHFRVDSTNLDTRIPRNRIRIDLLPYLKREFSRGIAGVLAREAEIARQDEDFLHAAAQEAAASIIRRQADKKDGPTDRGPADLPEIDVDLLTRLHPAIAARVARFVLSGSGGFVGFDQVERLLRFAREGRSGMSISLPAMRAVHLGDRVIVGPEKPRQKRETNSFAFPLSIPGEVLLADQGWVVSAERVGPQPADLHGHGLVAAVDGELAQPLNVRSRRPGDRFCPLGLGGKHKKLQDFLVDRKVPRALRDTLPLVVDASDRIVWVVGEAVAEDFRVTEPSRGVILLKARRLGGAG